MEERIQERLHRAIEEQVFPGGIVGVQYNERQFILPVGRFTYAEQSSPVTKDTVYDVASVTKAIPVSCLALHLVEQNVLTLETPVIQVLPSLRTNYREEITVRHLLTQTLNFQIPLSTLKNHTPDDILATIFSTQFQQPPGTKMTYTNATSILLGMVIEQVSHKRLDRLADEVFFTPLGMRDTTFHPEDVAVERIVPTEIDSWRGKTILGVVHDESAYTLRKKMIPGSAGLFSTAPDLLRFLKMLLRKGEYMGKRYFTEDTISLMSTDFSETMQQFGGLGWELYQPQYMGTFVSERAIGKTGYTGCVVIADIPKERGIVFLSNYHYPLRKQNSSALNAVRRDIADIVFAD